MELLRGCGVLARASASGLVGRLLRPDAFPSCPEGERGCGLCDTSCGGARVCESRREASTVGTWRERPGEPELPRRSRWGRGGNRLGSSCPCRPAVVGNEGWPDRFPPRDVCPRQPLPERHSGLEEPGIQNPGRCSGAPAQPANSPPAPVLWVLTHGALDQRQRTVHPSQQGPWAGSTGNPGLGSKAGAYSWGPLSQSLTSHRPLS